MHPAIARSCHLLALVGLLLGPLAAADIYMTPTGAGTADGSSWENALAYNASPTSLQTAWDRLKPGDTCNLGEGDYEARPVTLRADGTDAAGRRTLRGRIVDGRRPVFVGTWSKANPASGAGLFEIASGSTWWAIENIGARNCRSVIETQSPGRVAHGRLANIEMEGVRDGVVILGGATATAPELGSHDIAIIDCRVVHYTKRGFRFRDGVHDIRLERCLADAGGKEWAVEAFHMGFNIIGGAKDSGVADHDITFTDCVARNNYWDAGETAYWQGDGFCAEGATYNLTFIGCEAYDNGDGGWDVKSPNPLLIGCVSLRNKKNFRFWAEEPGVVLLRCVGAYAVLRGGNSEATGIWVGGRTRAVQCSFVENAESVVMNTYHVTPEKRARMGIDLQSCLMTLSEAQQKTLEEFPTAKLSDCVIWRPTGQAGEALGYTASDAAKALTTAGQAFDSLGQGPAKGYHSSWRQENLLARGRGMQPLLPTVGRLLPAKPIALYQGKRPDGWYVSGWKDAAMGEAKGEGREGRSALTITASGGGGATYQTKNAGAVVNLADRERAAWDLCFGLKADAAAAAVLKIRAISLDKSATGKELDLRSTPGEGGWYEVRMPLKDFMKDPQQVCEAFAGIAIRVNGKLAAPVLIDQLRLEPAQ